MADETEEMEICASVSNTEGEKRSDDSHSAEMDLDKPRDKRPQLGKKRHDMPW